MATKQTPALEPRITISTPHPFNFFDQLREAFLKGYVVDPNGYLVLNVRHPLYLVEMTLPEGK